MNTLFIKSTCLLSSYLKGKNLILSKKLKINAIKYIKNRIKTLRDGRGGGQDRTNHCKINAT
jgi:hypothetical protein